MSEKRYTVVWADPDGTGDVEHVTASSPGEAREMCDNGIPPEAFVVAVFPGHHDDLSPGEGV